MWFLSQGAVDVLHLVARGTSAWVQLLCLGRKRELRTPLMYLRGHTMVCSQQIIPRMTNLQTVRHQLHLSSLPVYPRGARPIPSKTHPASFLRSSSLQAYDLPFFDSLKSWVSQSCRGSSPFHLPLATRARLCYQAKWRRLKKNTQTACTQGPECEGNIKKSRRCNSAKANM